jgi:hypothetical protein
MVSNLSVYHDDDYDDWVVEYNYGSYAAKVPDRIIGIKYCPFCGKSLTEV